MLAARQLQEQYDLLKGEVDALGPGFFEELEDMKQILHETLAENRRLHRHLGQVRLMV